MNEVYIVLCHPSDSRNVGGAIRAVANHGLAGIRVITHEEPDHRSWYHYSSSAVTVVNLEIFRDLETAVADCRLVLGTTRRERDPQCPPVWPAAGLTARIGDASPVAMVFGTERTGLTMAELDRCDAAVRVPTAERYESMNLSHAVACIGYELARPDPSSVVTPMQAAETEPPRAHAQARDAFFNHVHEVVAGLGYPPGRTPETFVRKLRRVVMRANPSAADLGLIAGVFSELRRLGGLAGVGADGLDGDQGPPPTHSQ